MATNKGVCIIAAACNKAGIEGECNNFCPHFIALHGSNRGGGRVALANIPRQYANVTVANSPVRKSQPEAYAIVDIYVKSFVKMFEKDLPENKRIKSLYLYSENTGTGKTTTAAAIANEYLKRHYIGSIKRGFKPKRRPVFFIGVNDLQEMYNEANRPNMPKDIAEEAARNYFEALNTAKTVDFLVLDDIGLRSASEVFTQDIYGLLNYRNTMLLPTVYTSNVPMKDLEVIYSKQVWDRARDMCMEVVFKGESKRGFNR
jgi:DNA replication protein DnaC